MPFIIYLFLVGCSNSDSQVNVDITQFNWKLISIELENETITVSEESYVKDSSYMLKFLDNSAFSLDTSINAAMGKYTINGNLLKLTDYQELSDAGTNDPEQLRINELLIQRLVKTSEFNTDEDNLILISMNDAFIFKKN
ncbi:META domain-containing protein [Hwangdonia seohaensis]|uniref:META domain-containing protein n=1 Tax=Hwangdonia seohaensis TaxID=1240727 RepID=A0ABW3R707_9FLAO|nr:META domain-containing protein [Hwangdonia seohaensis]